MLILKGWFGKNLVLAALALLWVLGAGGCSQSTEPSPADAPQAGAVSSTAAPAKSDSAAVQQLTHEAPINKAFLKVVARTRFGDLTLKDLQYYAMTNLCPVLGNIGPTSLTTGISKQTMTAAVNWIASRQAATAEVDAKNEPELNRLVISGFKERLDTFIFAYMLHNEIMDQVTTPTQAELQTYYEKIKPTLFQPFSFTMRLMLLQTYEPPYVVQAGDSLESIAQQISGDPKMADLIRADVPSRPLRREPGKLFKPLYPGEKLLVPMNKERMQEVRTRLEALSRGFDKIADTHEREIKFLAMARKYDESGMKGEITGMLPTGTKQGQAPLTEIVKIVQETPEKQVSKIFQTKHGFNILFVEDKVESHSLPLDNPEVHQTLVDTLMKERIMKANDNTISALMDNPRLSVDYKLIASGNRLTSDTVVAVLGDEKLIWNDFKGSWTSQGSPSNESLIRKALIRNQAFAGILFRDHLRPVLANPKSELAQQMTTMRTALVGSTYLVKLTADTMAKMLTRDKARDFYEKNKEKYFPTPPMASFDAPLMLLSPANMKLTGQARQNALNDLLQQYREALAKLKTPDDILDFKAKLDQKLSSLGIDPIHSVKPVPLTDFNQQMQALLSKAQVGKWTEPVVTQDNAGVFAILLRSYTPAGVEPFEAVIDKVNKQLYLQENSPIFKNFENEYLHRAEVRLLE